MHAGARLAQLRLRRLLGDVQRARRGVQRLSLLGAARLAVAVPTARVGMRVQVQVHLHLRFRTSAMRMRQAVRIGYKQRTPEFCLIRGKSHSRITLSVAVLAQL